VGLEGRPRDFGADFGVLDRARLLVAGCLGSAPEFLVVPEVEATLPPAETQKFLKLLHGWSRIERLGVIVSGAPTRMLLDAADRVLELKEGLLTFDGPAADLLRRASAEVDPGIRDRVWISTTLHEDAHRIVRRVSGRASGSASRKMRCNLPTHEALDRSSRRCGAERHARDGR
jgi:ABC-type glutathione transport system ATPase component